MEFRRILNPTPMERKWTSSTGGVRFFSGKAQFNYKAKSQSDYFQVEKDVQNHHKFQISYRET